MRRSEKRFSFRWLLGVVPIVGIVVSISFPGAAWAAVQRSEPPATTSVTGQDPVIAGCWDDSGALRWIPGGIKWMPLGPLSIPVPDRQPVLSEGVAQTPITDGQGKVLGTLRLFHSTRCAGFFGFLMASGDVEDVAQMQAIALTGGRAYPSLTVHLHGVISPMVADGPQVCVQGNIDEGSTTYSDSVCAKNP